MDISREASDFNRVYDKWLCTTDEQHMRRESTRYLYVYRCILRFGHRQRWRVMMMRWWYSSGDKTLHWMWPLKVCKLHASAVSYVRPKQQKRLRIMFTLYKYRIYTIHTKWVRSNWLNWFQAVLELRPSLEEYYFFFPFCGNRKCILLCARDSVT